MRFHKNNLSEMISMSSCQIFLTKKQISNLSRAKKNKKLKAASNMSKYLRVTAEFRQNRVIQSLNKTSKIYHRRMNFNMSLSMMMIRMTILEKMLIINKKIYFKQSLIKNSLMMMKMLFKCRIESKAQIYQTGLNLKISNIQKLKKLRIKNLMKSLIYRSSKCNT